MYYCGCTVLCAGTSLICAVSYILGFYTVYKQDRSILTSAAAQKVKVEIKLAIVGCLLSVSTFLCAVLCASMVMLDMTHELMIGKRCTLEALHELRSRPQGNQEKTRPGFLRVTGTHSLPSLLISITPNNSPG